MAGSCRSSSVGQSDGIIIRASQVRVLPPAFTIGSSGSAVVAQDRRIEGDPIERKGSLKLG